MSCPELFQQYNYIGLNIMDLYPHLKYSNTFYLTCFLQSMKNVHSLFNWNAGKVQRIINLHFIFQKAQVEFCLCQKYPHYPGLSNLTIQYYVQLVYQRTCLGYKECSDIKVSTKQTHQFCEQCRNVSWQYKMKGGYCPIFPGFLLHTMM